MTEYFRVVEKRDDENGLDIGLLFYVNKETWNRLVRLCRKTGGGPDSVVEESLTLFEKYLEFMDKFEIPHLPLGNR